MKMHQLMTAVALAALMAVPALADMPASNQKDTTVIQKDSTVTGEVKSGWNDTKHAVSNTTENVKGSGDVIKAALLPADAKAPASTIAIDKRMTASGILDKPVYNQKNERVATVEDVILDSEGHANMIVVKDSSFMGLGGKLAAFDYDAVIDRTKEGDIVMPITQKAIDNVAEFSYKSTDKPTVRAMPEQGYSVKKILAGNLVDPNGKKVADIDNISLRDGRANMVIAAYNQILGLGGDRVALNFDSTQITRDKDDLNLKLTAAQVQEFENFKSRNK